MKKLLLIPLMIMSFNLLAADESAAPAPQQQNRNGTTSGSDSCKEMEKAAKPYNAKTKNLSFPGSDELKECDTLARGHMRKLYSGTANRSNFDWDLYIKYACCDGKDEKCVDTQTKKAMACESVAYVLNTYGRNWEDGDQVRATDTSSAAAAAAAPKAAAGATVASIASASSIKCKSAGIETVDYETCKKFQVQLDLIEGVQAVGYATQELVYKDKAMDAQAKYATEQNTATGALKATGESLKQQQDMYEQRTAVDATKLAYLYSIYNEMPSTDEVKKKCGNLTSKSVLPFGKIDKEVCEEAVGTSGGFQILMNQQQTEAMKSKLIGIATSAGANALLSNLLGKRASDVDNAIAKIDAFKPVDPFTTTEADAQSTLCKANPGLPQCLTAGLDRTFDTMNDNVITFGNGATGTQYGNSGSPDGTTVAGGITDSSARTAVTPVGSIIAAANQDNTMEKSDAAKVTAGGTGSSGGGGGGSGGGAGGGLAGGGGAPPAAATGGVAAAIQGKTPTYGGGGFSVMGGSGLNKKKADGKDEGNPFGKLFGKDNPKGDGVLNFRDIASQKVGSKGDNLFDMISKRYTSVNADKRLLEYELAK
ncbi:MAG: hypothetical protein H7177_07395 [Rhizobacter sp.]|nr:hypothetical protein [Bacteriovorax sp.]